MGFSPGILLYSWTIYVCISLWPPIKTFLLRRILKNTTHTLCLPQSFFLLYIYVPELYYVTTDCHIWKKNVEKLVILCEKIWHFWPTVEKFALLPEYSRLWEKSTTFSRIFWDKINDSFTTFQPKFFCLFVLHSCCYYLWSKTKLVLTFYI